MGRVLKPTAEQQAALELFLAGESLVLEAGAGCIAGEASIGVNRAGKGSSMRLSHVVKMFNGGTSSSRKWDLTIPTLVRTPSGDGTVRLARLLSAKASGVRPVYSLTVQTDDGLRLLDATAEHRLLTPDGWVPLCQLRVGSRVLVGTGKGPGQGRTPKRNYLSRHVPFHPQAITRGDGVLAVPTHRLNVEASMNGLDLEAYVWRLRTSATGLRFLDPAVHVHHKDGNEWNNGLDNLEVLTAEEHRARHYPEWSRNVQTHLKPAVVLGIIPNAAELATFDLEVEGVHAFMANDIAVHNSGKTSTLKLLAQSVRRRGQYLAFNKAIVTESAGKMPDTVQCNTAHSLAFRAVGHRYKDRLSSGKRLRGFEIARVLDARDLTVKDVSGHDKTLTRSALANLTMQAIGRFCQSADPAPTTFHVPQVPGLSEDSQRAVAAHVWPYLTRSWTDLMDTKGQLRFAHDHYLKAWQLSRPKIEADYILFDECQPSGTRVLIPVGRHVSRRGEVTPTQYVSIESLHVGDRVVSYDPKGRLRPTGSVVTDIRSHAYTGPLIVVQSTDGKVSQYTPEHKCMAAIGPALFGKHVLYLMQRGVSFRIGVTVGLHGKINAGPRTRLQEERGDRAWILSVHENRTEALAAEAWTSWKFGLPEMRFRGQDRQEAIDSFWSKVGDLTEDARQCLKHHGRSLLYPLWEHGPKTTLTSRPMLIRACNLLDGMCLADGDMLMANTAQRRIGTAELRPVTVRTEAYTGLVWSLEVDGDHTYVADGLVTHNCQDANPVMQAVVSAQTHAQLVWVGDSQQSIYAFTGAVNALAKVKNAHRLFLTQSFRFGEAIAEVSNLILAQLQAPLRLRGTESIPSTVEEVAEPDVILTRTNATAVRRLIGHQRSGRKAHLVGGGQDVQSFARAVLDMKAGRKTEHPDLACFARWSEVLEYAEQDQLGGDLQLLVRLIEEFRPQGILDALEACVDETEADVAISTAHKSKGREWAKVQLAGDFIRRDKDGEIQTPDPEELRLLYVACTRARLQLDCDAVKPLIYRRDDR